MHWVTLFVVLLGMTYTIPAFAIKEGTIARENATSEYDWRIRSSRQRRGILFQIARDVLRLKSAFLHDLAETLEDRRERHEHGNSETHVSPSAESHAEATSEFHSEKPGSTSDDAYATSYSTSVSTQNGSSSASSAQSTSISGHYGSDSSTSAQSASITGHKESSSSSSAHSSSKSLHYGSGSSSSSSSAQSASIGGHYGSGSSSSAQSASISGHYGSGSLPSAHSGNTGGHVGSGSSSSAQSASISGHYGSGSLPSALSGNIGGHVGSGSLSSAQSASISGHYGSGSLPSAQSGNIGGHVGSGSLSSAQSASISGHYGSGSLPSAQSGNIGGHVGSGSSSSAQSTSISGNYGSILFPSTQSENISGHYGSGSSPSSTESASLGGHFGSSSSAQSASISGHFESGSSTTKPASIGGNFASGLTPSPATHGYYVYEHSSLKPSAEICGSCGHGISSSDQISAFGHSENHSSALSPSLQLSTGYLPVATTAQSASISESHISGEASVGEGYGGSYGNNVISSNKPLSNSGESVQQGGYVYTKPSVSPSNIVYYQEVSLSQPIGPSGTHGSGTSAIVQSPSSSGTYDGSMSSWNYHGTYPASHFVSIGKKPSSSYTPVVPASLAIAQSSSSSAAYTHGGHSGINFQSYQHPKPQHTSGSETSEHAHLAFAHLSNPGVSVSSQTLSGPWMYAHRDSQYLRPAIDSGLYGTPSLDSCQGCGTEAQSVDGSSGPHVQTLPAEDQESIIAEEPTVVTYGPTASTSTTSETNTSANSNSDCGGNTSEEHSLTLGDSGFNSMEGMVTNLEGGHVGQMEITSASGGGALTQTEAETEIDESSTAQAAENTSGPFGTPGITTLNHQDATVANTIAQSAADTGGVTASSPQNEPAFGAIITQPGAQQEIETTGVSSASGAQTADITATGFQGGNTGIAQPVGEHLAVSESTSLGDSAINGAGTALSESESVQASGTPMISGIRPHVEATTGEADEVGSVTGVASVGSNLCEGNPEQCTDQNLGIQESGLCTLCSECFGESCDGVASECIGPKCDHGSFGESVNVIAGSTEALLGLPISEDTTTGVVGLEDAENIALPEETTSGLSFNV